MQVISKSANQWQNMQYKSDIKIVLMYVNVSDVSATPTVWNYLEPDRRELFNWK